MRFVPDTTSPVLLSFSIDLTDGTLSFTFSEPVNIASFQPSQVSLHGGPTLNGTYLSDSSLVTLTGGYSDSPNGRILSLYLSSTNLNTLKSSNFFKSNETTYLSISNMTITDLSLVPNFVTEIPLVNPLQVCIFLHLRLSYCFLVCRPLHTLSDYYMYTMIPCTIPIITFAVFPYVNIYI